MVWNINVGNTNLFFLSCIHAHVLLNKTSTNPKLIYSKLSQVFKQPSDIYYFSADIFGRKIRISRRNYSWHSMHIDYCFWFLPIEGNQNITFSSLETPSRDDAPKTTCQWSGLLPATWWWWWPYHLSSSPCLAHSFHHYFTLNVAQNCDLVQYHIYFHARYPCTKPQCLIIFLSRDCLPVN